MSVEEKCSTHQRRRRALSVDEQCQLLARHGIKFEQCCREDAKHFLKIPPGNSLPKCMRNFRGHILSWDDSALDSIMFANELH